MPDTPFSLDDALRILAESAVAADGTMAWPERSWNAVRDAGVLGWPIPAAYGGSSLAPLDQLHGYRRLAGACLTTAFLLSQRDAAVRYIRSG